MHCIQPFKGYAGVADSLKVANAEAARGIYWAKERVMPNLEKKTALRKDIIPIFEAVKNTMVLFSQKSEQANLNIPQLLKEYETTKTDILNIHAKGLKAIQKEAKIRDREINNQLKTWDIMSQIPFPLSIP